MNEFCFLPEEKQATILYEQGVYIGKRKLSHTTILLYQVESFYVEIHYVEYRRFIESINCFSGTAKLDPYLQEIDVEHLV